jgi:hypothetical protein
MSKPQTPLLAALVAAFGLSASAAATAGPSVAPEGLQYVQSSCSISAREFGTWFEDGHIAAGGDVKFADSLAFPESPSACDFYKWAHQMFLWINSPEAGGTVLDSPVFFDLIFDSNGGTYVRNGAGAPGNRFSLRGSKPQQFQPGGQAGGNETLLSLKGSLVYFATHANDVFAWFNTTMINGEIAESAPFPTTQMELAKILAYASQNGSNLKDGNALTLELKTAWVDASTVADHSQYITTVAAVPRYLKTSSSTWTIDAKQPTEVKTLALVGMHVVGPVKGHPEVVWATFEHEDNAPNNDFYFNSLFGPRLEVPYNSQGDWNFMQNGGSRDGALVAQMTVQSNGDLQATQGNSIRPNDVYRVNPWGSAPTPASADNNSQLISLNFDIELMLGLVKDVRANYIQVGAVWSKDGSIPASGTDPMLAGSLLLANSTMETYHQEDTPGCFGCHNSEFGLSHLVSGSNTPLVPKSRRPPLKRPRVGGYFYESNGLVGSQQALSALRQAIARLDHPALDFRCGDRLSPGRGRGRGRALALGRVQVDEAALGTAEQAGIGRAQAVDQIKVPASTSTSTMRVGRLSARS